MLGCSRAGRGGPEFWMGRKRAAEKAMKRPRALGSPALRFHAHWSLMRCSCSASALTERTTLPSASPSPQQRCILRNEQGNIPARKTSQAGATIRAVPILSEPFQSPVLPHPFPLYLHLPSSSSFPSQTAAFGRLRRCVPPRAGRPSLLAPLFPAGTKTRGSPDLISKTNTL